MRALALAGLGVLFVVVAGARTTCVPVEPTEVLCTFHDECGAGDYCAKAVGDCEGEGRCEPQPEPCVLGLWAPQCGCDGETYDQPCSAAAAGVNVAHAGECAACDEETIGFSQDNPAMFEFYEVCIPRGAEGAPDAVQAIDPSLQCGFAGVFAGCDREREVGCHGDLAFVPGTRRITDAKWRMLCALSVHPLVTRMGGGHFID